MVLGGAPKEGAQEGRKSLSFQADEILAKK